MTDDNGNHGATPALWKQGYGPDSWLLEATAEIDRLKALNAELLEALEKIETRAAKALPYPAEEYAKTADECWEIARAALAKARKED